jgi:mannose-1-phosphate guanylyltransferase/mannose-6-phosphate isomerase
VNLIPVLLSGGVGSRLWPVSREAHPKPFMKLADGQSLLQKTFLRAASLAHVTEIITVTNRELLFKTEDDYQTVNKKKLDQSFILEPFGRNTAAAIAVAALHLRETHGPDAHMLVLAADHLIQDQVAFEQVVRNAMTLSAQGWLVTFGIQPTHPETGFGYLEAGLPLETGPGLRVTRFVEKPDAATAAEYLAAGNYFWNSGMFCFQVGTVLNELQAHAPELLATAATTLAASRLAQASGYRCLTVDAPSFEQVPDISFDYAVMEHSERVVTVPCNIGWSDVGSWNTISELTTADHEGNRANGELLAYDARNNYVQSETRLTALIGVEDLLVVDTPDALMIAHKDRAQDVKHIVAKLKATGHTLHKLHNTVHRPWGTYTTLEEGDRFKIKRIVVKPKASLSLQLHHHRSEHWIVVSGMAVVVNDEQTMMLATNESTFIRAGHQHRLQNPGVIDLVLIEVQSGDYLGEDDIVRLEDVYGRVDA